MKWLQNSASILKTKMNTILEKLIGDTSRIAIAVSAMLLVACNSESVSTDSSAKRAASSSNSNVEVLGEINATLNGEQRTWYVTREYAYGRWISESNQALRDGTGTVILTGHVSDDSATNPLDLLMINAHVRDSADGPTVQVATIVFAGQEMWQGRYSSEYDGEAVVEFSAIESSDGATRLQGTFSGKLPYKSNSSAGPDMSNIVMLESGEFDVNLVSSE